MSQELSNRLLGTILKALVKLAAVPVEQPEHTAKIKLDNLQQFLPLEHRAAFNEDMSSCLIISTEALFDLSPSTVATNILPVYASFLSTQIARGLINYSAQGAPIELELFIDTEARAVATIRWAYSTVDLIAGGENGN